MSPKNTSYQSIFLLKNKGSSKAAKNAPIENIAKVMETLETFMALKKVIQWMAISTPTKVSWTIAFVGNTKDLFLTIKKISKNTLANPMRYQTKEVSPMEISSPKTAVNPQIKTIKWRCR